MKNAIIICTAILFFSSCKKETKELPPATQTGANTFGLKINGEMWVPKGFAGIPDADLLTARLLDHTLIIKAQNFSASPTETEFELHLVNVTSTGTFLLNTDYTYPNALINYAYHLKRRLTPLDEWVTSAAQTGSITLTRFDTTARIVSGTFQFNAENDLNAAQTISVTDGRFDIKY
ncbi:MAG TPA: DUF6252 family protein [Chitinophagaceae bacterium]|nr:DUF6252 family protein [Chitinophagaceae bacterium]